MLWFKAFHIISMVAWFAGLFYLPRLYVYHATTTDELSLKRFNTMERRLYYGIMWPAALLTSLFGLLLLHDVWPIYMKAAWLHAKLSLVVALWGFHLYCGYLRKQFANRKNRHSAYFYRVVNELPTVILVSIVILVVVKPF